jgi:hypothetical protein
MKEGLRWCDTFSDIQIEMETSKGAATGGFWGTGDFLRAIPFAFIWLSLFCALSPRLWAQETTQSIWQQEQLG